MARKVKTKKEFMNEPLKKLVRIFSRNKHITAVYVFGSYAKKKNTPLSDIDVCVFTDSIKITEKMRSDIISHGSDELDINIFSELPITVQIRVFNEGIPLFVRDEEFVNHIQAETISRFLDFKPVLHTYYKKALGMEYEI